MLDLRGMVQALGLDQTKSLAGSYRAVFDNEEGRRVLGDLANFCAATTTTVQPTDRETFTMEGRRQAFLRIAAWLKLDWRDFEELQRELFDHE